mmetsp:Transcript_17379/g.43671  ORF Transcript_17379/g.43671 Transcript_17379/m.43671 type:complete len:242 (+) Transcript_17379:3666-4391(+)
MVRGTRLSSFVCNRHLRMPSSLPVGNGRDGSLSASTFCELYAALSMLGCVLNWNCLLGPDATATRMKASASLFTTSDIVPCTSRFSSPPCLLSVTLSFSSMLRVRGSVDRLAVTVVEPNPPAGPAFGTSTSTASPSFASVSRKSLVFLALPSCMPFAGPRLAAGLGAGGSGLEKLGAASASGMPPADLLLLEPKAVREEGANAAIFLLSILLFSISMAFFFMMSLVSLILLWMIILCSFSS